MATDNKGGSKLDQVVSEALKSRDKREKDYREQALKMYPWICGRCSREFNRENLYELTVHHRNHNHDDNPSDGSNWELLCVYCHDNEHSRYVDHVQDSSREAESHEGAKQQPFADLKALLKNRK
ncbi:MAG TPA: HNH nuclease family protein [Gammaproteobacteria bacterium]|nr:HNH nuclease family protein [Gammaproteobacteria bacterium]